MTERIIRPTYGSLCDEARKATLLFPILLHIIETRGKLQPCQPRLACSEPFLYLFFFKGREQRTEIHADMTSFAHPSLLPWGLERLKNARRLERSGACTSRKKESHISTVLILYGSFWNRKEYTFTGETHRNSLWAPRTSGSRFSSLASLTSSSTTFTRALTEKIKQLIKNS